MGSLQSSDALLGEKWKHKIMFDLNTDNYEENWKIIKPKGLKQFLQNHISEKEKTEHVWVYKTPLNQYQLMNTVFYHSYLVIKTDVFWYSIEKNSEYILIQRNEKEEGVRDMIKCQKRCKKKKNFFFEWKPKQISYRPLQFSLKEMITLFLQPEAENEYNIWSSNCKHFAEKLFKYLQMIYEKKMPIIEVPK